MKRLPLLLTHLFLFASPEETMLSQADKIGQAYSQEIAKTPTPTSEPLSSEVLTLSSVWLSLSLDRYPIESLMDENTWKMFKEMGIEGVRVENLRKPGEFGINPEWAKAWPQVVNTSQLQGMTLIGDLTRNSTVAGSDFQEAIQNKGDYPNLYKLVEIDRADWELLPAVPVGTTETNIPWLSVQTLHKRGYILEKTTPYVKTSDWNVTEKIPGVDGKTRRWVYLKEGTNQPVLNWLSPSFAAYRLLSGDALNQWKQNGQQILHIDGSLPRIAQEMISLWIRKIGAYSAVTTTGSLDSMKNVSSDLLYDAVTKPALLHAMITEDAEALRMIYRILLHSKIENNRLVHVLQPFDQNACEWVELMNAPKKKFLCKEEQVTGEVLKNRLLKEDIMRFDKFDKIPESTWVDYCARALNVNDFEKNREEITNAHLLLAFTYAMQPGAFSISYDDLMGTLPNSNDTPLYADIPCQLCNRNSFASRLKSILYARSTSNIKTGELVDVIQSPNPGTLLLLYRIPKNKQMQLLAINFARKDVEESLERKEFSQTTAIDIMARLSEEKVFSSAQFSFTLPAMSGRSFYFQPKYY